MDDELKPCKYCGCDWGHTGECPLDSPGAVERSRLKAENAALRAEVERLKADGMKALQAAAETGELAMNLTAEVAALKAMYTEPLTERQAHIVFCNAPTFDIMQAFQVDAAIRAAREGGK